MHLDFGPAAAGALVALVLVSAAGPLRAEDASEKDTAEKTDAATGLPAGHSAHGEAFNEHGRFLHTRWLFEEFIHVPLVVKWPAAARGRS